MTTAHPHGLARLARRAVPAISIVVLGTLVAACDRSTGSSSANPTQNAGATDVSLTVTSNAIAGGKNAAEADWYANYVIPKFTEAQKAKGVNVTLKFQPSGVDDDVTTGRRRDPFVRTDVERRSLRPARARALRGGRFRRPRGSVPRRGIRTRHTAAGRLSPLPGWIRRLYLRWR